MSERTKQLVREAAEALGYVPSSVGRALSEGRSRRIGLLLTDLENQFYPHVISAMHTELENLGYQLMLMTESSDSGPAADRVIANTRDGVLLATTTIDSVLPVRMRDRGVPFVYFNRTGQLVDADSVTVDPDPGLRELIRTVVDQGHHRVATIFGPKNTSTGQIRENLVRSLLLGSGIALKPENVVYGPFDFATGQQGSYQFLTGADRPTVIVCGNDVVALGALHTAVELGLDIPGEVSIVGFDDLPMSSWAFVRLTTVAFDLDAMSREAARLLVSGVEGRLAEDDYRHVVFPTRFVGRATLRAPRPSVYLDT